MFIYEPQFIADFVFSVVDYLVLANLNKAHRIFKSLILSTRTTIITEIVED